MGIIILPSKSLRGFSENTCNGSRAYLLHRTHPTNSSLPTFPTATVQGILWAFSRSWWLTDTQMMWESVNRTPLSHPSSKPKWNISLRNETQGGQKFTLIIDKKLASELPRSGRFTHLFRGKSGKPQVSPGWSYSMIPPRKQEEEAEPFVSSSSHKLTY